MPALNIEEILNGAKPKTLSDRYYIPGVGLHDPTSEYQKEQNWTDEANLQRRRNRKVDDEVEKEHSKISWKISHYFSVLPWWAKGFVLLFVFILIYRILRR